MSYWLLEPSTFQSLSRARLDAASLAVRAEEYTARIEARDGQAPSNLLIAGSTAEIQVSGVLSKRPDFFAMLFGGGNTTYQDIRASLALAETNPGIKDVVLHIDSPGGSVDGLIDTLDAIATFRANSGKKIRVRAENAQSAAYGIAAAAGNIEAVGRGSTFGSIGTAASFYVFDQEISLTNTDSPDKRPDLRTPEGQAVIVKYLDMLNDEFVGSIARGRGVDTKEVLQSYGRGASMTAVYAKKLGMIDKILTTAPRAVPSKAKAMSDERAQDDLHVYDANGRSIGVSGVDGCCGGPPGFDPTAPAVPSNKGKSMSDERAADVQRGRDEERDRVIAHITMGEACGDLSIALEAIRSGAGMSLELNARYLSAGMARSDRQRRQTESNAAEAALAGVDQSTAGAPDLGDQVVALLKGAGRSFVSA